MCEAESIDDAIGAFDGVCTRCGFVLHGDEDTNVPEWAYPAEVDEEPDQDEWLAACRVRNATEQQLAEAFDVLEAIADRLGLSVEHRMETADTYCDAFRAETTDGRKTANVVAACLRLASLEEGAPIPAGRLTECPATDEKQFRTAYAALRADLEAAPGTPGPADYLPFLADCLEITQRRRQAIHDDLVDIARAPALVGKDPAGIAATAIYLHLPASTQADVADAAGVSTETIRLRRQQLEALLDDV